jgi:hypothetical protein
MALRALEGKPLAAKMLVIGLIVLGLMVSRSPAMASARAQSLFCSKLDRLPSGYH